MRQNITDGSVRQLLKIVIPLSISMLSTFLMLFIDRLFLSIFSPEALTAAASGATLHWMITGMFVCIAGMAGVFVSHNNGAGRYQEIATPVWQMIYFALLSTLIFWIVCPFCIQIFYNRGILTIAQSCFLKYNFYSAPLHIVSVAISTFYIGQGKTSIIKWVGIIGNIVNIVFAYLLIFGVKNTILPMGIKGAAIATGLGLLTQVIILGSNFLSKKNQKEFSTHKYKFNKEVFIGCFKKGFSSAIALFFELMGWSAYYIMIIKTGPEQTLIASIEQTIFLFFIFFGQALEKAVSSISGNLIGSNKIKEVKNLIISGIKLCIIFGLVTVIFLTLFSDTIVNTFINSNNVDKNLINKEVLIYIIQKFHTLMPLLGIYIFIENIRSLITGVLISSGDTFFTMIVSTVTIWIFMVFPTHYFMLEKRADIVYALIIFIVHSLITAAVLFIRFFYGRYIQTLEKSS